MEKKSLNRAVLVGGHPVLEGAARGYANKGYSLVEFASARELLERLGSGEGGDVVLGMKELFIAEDMRCNADAVNDSIALLQYFAECPSVEFFRCHMLIQDRNMFDLFRNGTCSDMYRSKMELIPFNENSLWGEKVFFGSFDSVGEPVGYLHGRTVHIVFFGLNDFSHSLAEYASLVCHYPNYVRDHSLRTRITVIDGQMSQKWRSFVNSRQHLFANSYYRYIDLISKPMSKEFHKPEYEGRRGDFVDVEWEFVNATVSSPVLREKLVLWSSSSAQQLTVMLCDGEQMENVSVMQQLPYQLKENGIPLYMRVKDKNMAKALKMGNVIPFGYDSPDYDISVPLVKMAKAVNYVYNCCSEVPLVEIDWVVAEKDWRRLGMAKRFSCISNAMTIKTKMRSLGLPEFDWSQFYGISAREIEIISRVEHNRWCVEELLLGFRPANDREQKAIEENISLKGKFKEMSVHYDLRSYDDLRPDSSGKDVRDFDRYLSAAIPLIANSLNEEERNG